MSLFQQTVLKKQMLASSGKIQAAYKLYAAYFHNPEIQENIRNSKEEQFQEGFLRELFVKILGYTLNPEPNYNLITEKKNETNSRKADGAIIVNGEVKAVIELKDHKTTDLKQVEAQAFGYKNNNRKTSYVIISNFEKLRFYIENTIDFEEFNLFELTEDDFAVLWICLAYENIVNDSPKRLKSESANNEDYITKKLYKDYSSFKQLLFENFCKNNPTFDKLELFRKTQKLLDRFLFVFFAEDKGLLPPNSMKRILDQWDRRNDDVLNEYQPLYKRLKLYFKYMDEGHKGKVEDVFGYNGGLFKFDEILEAIVIDDDVLKENILKLVVYDFDTEVDVNILGHIFEHSLTEIEILTPVPSPNGEGGPTGRGEVRKRKQDGIFYTPRYITTYIVENTLGKLCVDKKAELKIDESEYITDKKRLKTQTKQLSDKLTEYREWLLSLTICDPACGSGAFLNAALDFLMAEHRYIDELTAKLFGNAIVFPNIENAILENNLYGVDINEESVEIAKLALWLRTAKPQRKLNSLNNNIKCGNSLIAPSSPPSPLHFGEGCPAGRGEDEVRTVEIQLPPQLLAYARDLRKNQTEAEDLLWQLLRNRKFNHLKFRRQHPLVAGFILDFYCAEIKLGIELDGGYHNETEQKEYDEERTKIVNEYGINIIRFKNDDIFLDIENVLKKIIIAATPPSPNWRGVGGEEKAFDWHKEFPQVFEKGGFDVVIGNPPYVPAEYINPQDKEYFENNYKSAFGRINLYPIFYERGLNLLKSNGLLGFITPYTILKNQYYKEARKYIIENAKLLELIDFKGISVFQDAAVDSIIMILQKQISHDYNFKQISQIVSFENQQYKTCFFDIKEIEKREDLSMLISENDSLIEKLNNNTIQLKEVISFNQGIITGGNSEFLTSEQSALTEKVITGSDFNRYSLKYENALIIYDVTKLHRPRKREVFEAKEKILLRQTGAYPICTIDTAQYYTLDTVHNGILINDSFNLKYLLALLNSKLMRFLYESSINESGKVFAQVKIIYVDPLPIKEISLEQQQPFVALADKMLSLNSDLQTKRQRFLKRLSDNFTGIKITGILEHFDGLEFKQFLTELVKQKISLSLKQQDEWEEYFNEYKTECANFVNQIHATDKEIDGMVYELYGLTEEEVGIIEGK